MEHQCSKQSKTTPLLSSSTPPPSFLPPFLTIRGVLKHQALQFRPLGVESLHQFVCVDWVGQVALWVRSGHSGQLIKFVGPAKRQTDKMLLLLYKPPLYRYIYIIHVYCIVHYMKCVDKDLSCDTLCEPCTL